MRDPFEYPDQTDFESPDANQRRDELTHIHVRNSDEPDELFVIPRGATDDELETKWLSASGAKSFVDLEDVR